MALFNEKIYKMFFMISILKYMIWSKIQKRRLKTSTDQIFI